MRLSLQGLAAHEPCRRWSSLRRSRRTPLRLREDPQICYADILRQTVDNDIRYKQTPQQQQAYKKILGFVIRFHQKLIKKLEI